MLFENDRQLRVEVGTEGLKVLDQPELQGKSQVSLWDMPISKNEPPAQKNGHS